MHRELGGNMFGAIVSELRQIDTAEHIAAQNPGAHILHPSMGPVIVNTRRAALKSMHLLPGARGEKPLEQLRPTHAERIFDALVSSGGVAVERHTKGVNAHYSHGMPPV